MTVFRSILATTLVLVWFSAQGMASGLQPRDGWRIIDTPHAFSELVDRVKAAVKAEKMGLVTQASASAGAKGQGIVIPGNQVLGVYRNDYARRMLNASIAAGIEAPIRFYITENGDKSATLSWKTPSEVFGPYMAEGGDDLKVMAAELDGVFEAIAKRATSE
ncbi:DUF302 domain-containing protein [Labrenzia sp. CE80]|uniref:DUF302 domain-containing protein n=1 Tax=Labrenzia sp. CE80 TaxID=1788986 RepID=UPI001878DC38|nr:DUF302 domain-containing protein [Labrenzia sp. CE80]